MKRATKIVGIIGFDGANAFDIVGPLEAFYSAGRSDCTDKDSRGSYEVVVAGLSREAFTAESGVRLVPHCRLVDAPRLDTVIVPGGPGLRERRTNEAVVAWLLANAERCRRVASVCTGIYGLAATGLLDGRRATTHWRFAEDVARRFPAVHVDGNALFLKDGRYYTSGGISAGVDLSLALIEEDLGPQAALSVAREMVVYLKRPGGQEQYSEPLRFQAQSPELFSDLVAWICAHLDRDLSIEVLAARVRLSPRHFSRRFTAALGLTPANFVEAARLRAARDRMMERRHSIEQVAASVGYSSADVFRRRFDRRFGISPKSYRERFAPHGQAFAVHDQ